MSRRGQCRCGAILTFMKTSRGYKGRCPACKAVVRLQTDQSVRVASPPPLGSPAGPIPTEPPDFSVLSLHESSAPIALVELEVYREPRRGGAAGRWWLLGLALVGVVAAAWFMVLILG